jgi:hypothetical protein
MAIPSLGTKPIGSRDSGAHGGWSRGRQHTVDQGPALRARFQQTVQVSGGGGVAIRM